MRLPEYFPDYEIDCPCCGLQSRTGSVHRLYRVRLAVGTVKVNSGRRCTRHNDEVGGVMASSHLSGQAFDVHTPNAAYKYKLVEAAIASGFTRIIVHDTFVHMDDLSETFHLSIDYDRGQGKENRP